MKPWQAILLTLGIAIISIWLLPYIVVVLIVLGTSIWAAIDSSRIGLYRYKSLFAVKPFVLFIALLILWIVVFPGYLIERYRISNGLAQLKDKYKSEVEITK